MPTARKLRVAPLAEPFHVVLLEPEIPQNTGSIARTCVATGSPLHLVGKLGFRIDEHAVRRAGLDYWHLVDVRQHPTLVEAEASIRSQAGEPAPRTFLLSGSAKASYLDVQFQPGDLLVFGKESVGLPRELLAEREGSAIGIPMLGGVRSHNLANAVSIVLYEALRQTGMLAGARLD